MDAGSVKEKSTASSKRPTAITPTKFAVKSSKPGKRKRKEIENEDLDVREEENRIENSADGEEDETELFIQSMVEQLKNVDPSIRTEIAKRFNKSNIKTHPASTRPVPKTELKTPIKVLSTKTPSKTPPSVRVIPSPMKYSPSAVEEKASVPEKIVRKEKLPTSFNGETNLNDWILQFELAATYNRWNEEEKLAQLPFALTGIALSFLKNTELVPSEITWENIKKLLEDRFNPVSSEIHFRSQLRKLNQKKEETINSFLGRLETIASNLKDKLSETDMKSHFLDGLLPQFKQQLILHTNLPWKELSKVALQLDGFRLKKEPPKIKVDEVSVPPISTSSTSATAFMIDSNIDFYQTATGEPICWNCERVGHSQDDCTENSYSNRPYQEMNSVFGSSKESYGSE